MDTADSFLFHQMILKSYVFYITVQSEPTFSEIFQLGLCRKIFEMNNLYKIRLHIFPFTACKVRVVAYSVYTSNACVTV